MNILIEINRIGEMYQAKCTYNDIVFESYQRHSFTFTIVEIGEQIHQILSENILAPENELTIKLLKA